ncbi:hypothetical protein CERZMDRAFT_99680 [Cercospora zeae-maydis SCOH1-5]|uniref:Uncharacterized protein n=1 Tax=Cercospora zeae-maydis SCOH1-5 TaxID=717836 RepID=A0A6A6FA32_9PEZI|nr:hypothetical protein CERZMDRAFT_99680 [Cercospora zeae-maydis SCOH1-5]
MSARYVSSSLLNNVKSKSGKQVALEVVDKTTSWSRPSGFPSEGVKQEFVKIAENNTEKFKPEVVKIAMKREG